MNTSIAAQASQAAQQGQDLYNEYKSKSTGAQGDYARYSTQATESNKKLEEQAAYMRGEGSGENVYNRSLSSLQSANGWNPSQLSDANKTLFSLNGALNSATQQFSTPGGVGAYGMSAPALAGYQGAILSPLQTGTANANTQVGVLNDQLKTFMTGASQQTTAQVQSEQQVVNALTEAVKNYQSQAAASLQSMQFYSDLAQKQGGFNSQSAAAYAQAQQSYAQAQQAVAQAGLLLAQTKAQQLANTQTQNVMNAPKPTAPRANGVGVLQGGSIGGGAVQGSNANKLNTGGRGSSISLTGRLQ